MKSIQIRVWFLPFFLVILGISTYGQEGPPNNKSEFEKGYEWRIRREVLNGVYIPKDLGDAFNELNKKIDKESQIKFAQVNEDTAASKLHFSLGRWMIVNWSFYEGSRFADYLRSAGISYPDDMARFVIITYHRYLNDEPLKVKELAQAIKERRKSEFEEKREQGTVIFEETRTRDTSDQKGN
jgi:hypothetical protein